MTTNTVFSGSKLNLFILIDSEIFLNSVWKFCITSLGLLDENKTFVSSE